MFMFVQISECCNHCCELLRGFLSVHVDPCGLGSSRSFGMLDGLPVLYCLKSETCQMTSNDGRSLVSQCKMDGSTTGPNGIIALRGDVHRSYNCDQESCTLAENIQARAERD